MAHPRHELDEALLTPVRLSIMAALSKDVELDFGGLRELLDAENSVLSKSISHLDGLGYVKVTKGFVGRRPRTWVKSTFKGRRAFERHVRALHAIMGDQSGRSAGEHS